MQQSTTRQSGTLLLELQIALAILVIGVLAYLSSFATGFRTAQAVFEQDESQFVLENIAETLRNTELSTIYDTYHNTTINVTELTNADGGPATCTVTCYTNETNLPSEFGPVFDIDGSGGLNNSTATSGYWILPVKVSVTYTDSYGTQTDEIFIVLGEDE